MLTISVNGAVPALCHNLDNGRETNESLRGAKGAAAVSCGERLSGKCDNRTEIAAGLRPSQ